MPDRIIRMTNLWKGKLNVVDIRGLSFCALRSFAIQMIGICPFSRVNEIECYEARAYFALFDESIQSSDTTPVTSWHAIHFIHDEAASVCDCNPNRVSRLHQRVRTDTLGGTMTQTSEPLMYISSDRLLIFMPFYGWNQRWLSTQTPVCTSTSLLLRVSLAFNSIAVYPANFAQRWALVVLPIPGDPVISTPRYMFMPVLPGFLKPAFKLSGLNYCPDEHDTITGNRRGNYQSFNHWNSFSTWLLFPQISFIDLGA